MEAVLETLAAPDVVAAIEANLCASYMAYGQVSTVEVYTNAGLTWVDTGVPSPWFNGVFCTHLAAQQRDTEIKSALAHFQTRQRPLIWWTRHTTETCDLNRCLEAHGLTRTAELPGMALDLHTVIAERPAPDGLTISCVHDLPSLWQWTRTATVGSGASESIAPAIFDLYAHLGLGPNQPWRYYLGWLDGVPVSTSAMCLAAGVAGIYSIATLPQARGRGLGTALTLAALRDARRLGYHIALLQSTPMGQSVYRALGFHNYCTFSCYAWMGENSTLVH